MIKMDAELGSMPELVLMSYRVNDDDLEDEWESSSSESDKEMASEWDSGNDGDDEDLWEDDMPLSFGHGIVR